MDSTDFGIYGHHGRRIGTHRTPRGRDHGPDTADGRVGARDSADEHFNTSPGPAPPFELAASSDPTDMPHVYDFPSPPPGKDPMVFRPKGTFDHSIDNSFKAEPSRASSDLGYTTKRCPPFHSRQTTRTPDTVSSGRATSDSESVVTVLGPGIEHKYQTLRDMETEHERQRETLIKRVTSERRPALLDAVAPELRARRSSPNRLNPDNDSETSNSDVSQIFSRRSSPTREESQILRRPRTAGDLQSESDRRQSRFLDFHTSGGRRHR